MLKTNTNSSGAFQSDYYSGDQRVFSDLSNRNAHTRIRTSFDMLGRVAGQRKDFPDGSSVSEFRDNVAGPYRVTRDRKGITVMKTEDSKWLRITNNEECSQVLSKEREIFAPPHLVECS